MSHFRISLITAIAITGMGRADTCTFGQTSDKSPERNDVAVEDFGKVKVVKDGEHRFGATELTFLIEDQWEFERCALLLPNLPKIDLKTESLLVIMSWKSRPRTLQSIHSEDETLVIQVNEAKPAGFEARFYEPPDFLVFKIRAWSGPVRFELNGNNEFTIVRGEALAKRGNELWEEILRLHSGGRPTREQVVTYYKRRAPDTSDEEIRRIIFTDKNKYLAVDPASLYPILFRELIDTRARTIIPRIFQLIESMGQHDKAFDQAFKAVVGIGGPEVLDHCRKGLKSWNPRSRHAAMLILRDLGLPESRSLAHEHLASMQQEVARCALDLLYRIGTTKEDAPAMISALEEIERFYLTPPNERPKVAHYSSDVGTSIMYRLGSLGPDAEAALPVLERFAIDPRLPVPSFQPDAKKAIEKIRAGAVNDSQ
jgi:hypothetical protein